MMVVVEQLGMPASTMCPAPVSLGDPHRFLDIVLSAADRTAAEAALDDQFGLSREQARAAMNMQFLMMSEETRQSIRTEADELRG